MLLSVIPSPTSRKTFRLGITALVAALAPFAFAQSSPSVPNPDKPQIAKTYGALPMSFERNDGQAGSPVRFFSRGAGYVLSLTDSDAVISLRRPSAAHTELHGLTPDQTAEEHPEPAKSDNIRMHLVDSSKAVALTAEDQLPGTVNYFLGNNPVRWRSGVPTFGRIRYTGAYPGVDLVYYGNQRHLEFDFEVAPGADPSRIQLSFAGAEKLKLDQDGNLSISTPSGAVSFHKPVIYQTVSGTRQPVKGAFRLGSAKTVSFSLGSYDHTKSLIIDPVLAYSTYLGNFDGAQGIAVDSNGNAYITGETEVDLPTTPGAPQNGNFPKINSMDYSVFVTKFNSTGTGLIYSTYIGGSSNDQGLSITLDPDNNAYVGGLTYSSDFPVTSGAFQASNHSASGSNGFVAKLNSTGTQLLYATYLGGSNEDVVRTIAADANGNAYVSGNTESSDFPVTPGALQSTNKTVNIPFSTAFLTKVNSTGTALSYSTYVGGKCGETGQGIYVDALGFAYLAGFTCSSDFPTTPGAIQTAYVSGSGFIGFVTKMNTTGTAPVYSTFLAGQAAAIAVDSAGSAYVTGTDIAGFPTTPGAFQPAPNGFQNAYVAKLNSSGTGLLYATYLGGSGTEFVGGAAQDAGVGIAVDLAGNAVVTGNATTLDFPVTPGAFQSQNLIMVDSGDFGTFLTKLNSTGTALIYSTFLSGTGLYDGNIICGDCANGIAVDPTGNVYLAGSAESTDFPLTLGAFQTLPSGVFVTKFNAQEVVTLPSTTTTLTANANPQATATPAIITAQVQPTAGNPTPTGSIAFSANQAPWSFLTLDNTGSASYSNSALPSGPNLIQVRYYGDDNNAPSSATMTESIDITSGNLPTVTTMTASANTVAYYTPITFNVSVKDPSGKGVPEGTVTFQYITGPFGRVETLDTSGNASITYDQLPPGADQISALFHPSNQSYASSYYTLTENVTPLGVTPAPVFSVPSGTYTSTQTVRLTDPSPAADISWTVQPLSLDLWAPYLGPLTISGSETINAYAVIAGYSPSPVVSATYVIAPNGQLPTPTFSPASGSYTYAQQIGITDSVQGADIYYTTDGTTPTLSSAVYGTPILINSSQTINAIAFDNGYSPSAMASATYVINILPPDFSVALSPTSLTVSSGQFGTSTVTVSPANGFTGSVTLASSGLPAGATCIFTPAIIGTTGASATSDLAIDYSSPPSANKRPASLPVLPLGSLAVAICWFRLKQRRARWFYVVVVAGVIGLTSITSCGSGGGGQAPSPPPTPTPVTSTVTITATSGTLSHTATLALTINLGL